MPAVRSGSRAKGSRPRGFLGGASWPRVATLACAGILASLALWGWVNLLPLLFVPALVGLAIGCCSSTRAEALIAGLVAGVLGSAFAVWVYEPNRAAAAVQGMTDWMWGDVGPTQYSVALGSLSAGAPMSAYVTHTSHAPVVVSGLLLLPAFAVGAVALREWAPTRQASSLLPWLVSALATLCLVAAIAHVGVEGQWFKFLDAQLGPGMYATDMMDNLRTLEIMKTEGKGYYAASAESAAGDVRSRSAVAAAGGKLPGISSAQIRQPATFYLWRLATVSAPVSAIGWLSLALAAMLVPLSYWGLKPALGHRALFVGFALFPGLVFWSTGFASLEPEWWAVVFLLAAFFVLARGGLLLSAALALPAVLMRETSGLWLLCACVAALLLGLRDRRWLRVAAVAGGLLAAAIVAFVLHVKAGSSIVPQQNNAATLVSYLVGKHGDAFEHRTLAPLAYLWFPYTLAAFNPAWVVPLGIVGLWVGLVRAPFARLVVTSYALGMVGFFLIVGAPSTYWGEIVNPFVIIGATLLVLSLDTLGSASTWRFDADTVAAPERSPEWWIGSGHAAGG